MKLLFRSCVTICTGIPIFTPIRISPFITMFNIWTRSRSVNRKTMVKTSLQIENTVNCEGIARENFQKNFCYFSWTFVGPDSPTGTTMERILLGHVLGHLWSLIASHRLTVSWKVVHVICQRHQYCSICYQFKIPVNTCIASSSFIMQHPAQKIQF